MTRGVLALTKGLGRGGTERLLVGTGRLLDPERYRMEIAYLLPWKDAFVADAEAAGVKTHCLSSGRMTDLAWVRRLRRLLATGRFDVLHTHMPLPAVAARLAVWGSRPRLVHTEHNLWDRYHSLTRWSNALTIGRNATVLAVSDSVASSIRPPRALGRRRPSIEVLTHGIDPAAVRRGATARSLARQTLGLGEDEPVIGAVGNFTAKKDHRTLLEAVRTVVADGIDARLVLVGTGPLEDDLRRATAELGLTEHVLFTGSRGDVHELMPAFDVFVLSSRQEGLPIALLEAMAAAVPCVCTSVGGVPEVVTDGQEGFLTLPGDGPAIAAAVGKLLRDPSLRRQMGETAAVRSADFALSDAVARLQDVYDEVLRSA